MRSFVQQFVGFRGPVSVKPVSDEAAGVHLPNHIQSHRQAPVFRPAGGELRRKGAHLAADQPDSVAVKTAAQIQLRLFGAVPGADLDARSRPCNGQRLIQGGGVAG